jgi:hypothetical protein
MEYGRGVQRVGGVLLQLAKASRRLDRKAPARHGEAWLNLAERTSRSAMKHARRVAERPLVRKTFGRFSGAHRRRVSTGSLAMLSAMRRASSRVKRCFAESPSPPSGEPPGRGVLGPIHEVQRLIK